MTADDMPDLMIELLTIAFDAPARFGDVDPGGRRQCRGQGSRASALRLPVGALKRASRPARAPSARPSRSFERFEKGDEVSDLIGVQPEFRSGGRSRCLRPTPPATF